MAIDTLIFDFDGVILDTETPEFNTWQDIFHSYGAELERDVWTQFIGGGFGTFNIYRHLEELTGKKINDDWVRHEMRSKYLAIVERNPVLPGVVKYIQGAKNLGLNLGIASSSDRQWVVGHLEKRGLLDYFDAIRSKDDVASVKPDPELYATSVSHFGSKPENTLAIEDSFNGVTAAKAAGIFCVAVPNPMTRDMPFDHADLRLESLSDFSLEALLNHFTTDK